MPRTSTLNVEVKELLNVDCGPERGTQSPRYRCRSLTHCNIVVLVSSLHTPPSLVYRDRYLFEETNRRKDGAVLVALNTAFDADDEPLLAPTSFMVASTVKTFNEAFCSEYVSFTNLYIYGRGGGAEDDPKKKE
jgi:hypothetical protein